MDVSVIIPAYNVERYLSVALKSVIGQRFQGTYEILVSDDVSKDSTPAIIAFFQSHYPETVKSFSHSNNIGASSSYLFLVGQAKGKYLAFLDSDDFWVSTDKLQLQFDFLESHPDVGMVCSNALFVDCEGKFGQNSLGKEGMVSFHEMISGHSDVFCSSVMMRTELFETMKEECKWEVENKCLFDTAWAFWFSYYGKLYRMEQILSSYRVLDNSDCHSTDSQKQFELAKRYYAMKTHFLLTHDVPIEEKMEVLLNEYDYNFRNAFFQGEQKVRKTRTFKMGSLLKIFKI